MQIEITLLSPSIATESALQNCPFGTFLQQLLLGNLTQLGQT